jgi:hypothetical protein
MTWRKGEPNRKRERIKTRRADNEVKVWGKRRNEWTEVKRKRARKKQTVIKC